LLWVALSFAGAPRAASRIEVNEGACGSRVHLVASDARLSDVLKRLAQTLDFQLEFQATSDPVISINLSRPAAELIAKLAPSENVIVTEKQDPRCPRQRRIAKVWVLPNAKGASAGPAAPAAITAQPSVDPDRRERMMKLRKQLEDAYIREHGVPPPSGDNEN